MPMSFDAGHPIQHHDGGPASGMKQIYLAAFLLCSALVPARADVVVPKPSQLVVSNLSMFPKVKFTIGVGDGPIEPLKENKTYEFMAATRLFVEDTDHKPRAWATVEYHGFKNESVKIVVKKVSNSKAGIEVGYDIDKAPLPLRPRKQPLPTTADAWPPFVLAGLGCCGLVLLAPRARRKAGPDDPSRSPGA